jgi:hypothetical protein
MSWSVSQVVARTNPCEARTTGCFVPRASVGVSHLLTSSIFSFSFAIFVCVDHACQQHLIPTIDCFQKDGCAIYRNLCLGWTPLEK